jgi:hypothetical protein
MSEIQTPAPQNKVVEQPINLKNKNNVIFAVILVAYEILTLPIFGSLYELNILNDAVYDYGGILLVSITTILLIIGKFLFI